MSNDTSTQIFTIQTTLGTLTAEPARADDLDLVMEIASDAARWLQARSIRQWRYPFLQEDWDEMAACIAAGDVYLARLGNGPAVGIFRFEWRDDELWHDDRNTAGYVHSLAIRDAARGHRIGAAILEWCKDYLRARGKTLMRIDCVADNPRLNQYYRDLGFTYRGQVDDDGYVASLFEMELC